MRAVSVQSRPETGFLALRNQSSISRWEKPLECGRQSASASPEAGLRLHSGSRIVKYCIACKCFSAAGEVFRRENPGFLTPT